MERTFETERLMLRPLTLEDAADVFEWTGDPEVNRYMPYPVHPNMDATKEWIRSIKPENGEFAFALKNTGKVIGSGSIRQDPDGRYIIGYNFNKQYWGRGYATEAAKGLIRWGYEQLGARRFSACHATANTASGNVLRKCGFRFERYGEYGRYDGSKTYDATFVGMELE
ncbi:MAG: GNAT family N-acetyltransferase [Clostridiales bacterium]|nr:GNAT family N-acetyltransferase [Clostridiales bacterium]